MWCFWKNLEFCRGLKTWYKNMINYGCSHLIQYSYFPTAFSDLQFSKSALIRTAYSRQGIQGRQTGRPLVSLSGSNSDKLAVRKANVNHSDRKIAASLPMYVLLSLYIYARRETSERNAKWEDVAPGYSSPLSISKKVSSSRLTKLEQPGSVCCWLKLQTQ